MKKFAAVAVILLVLASCNDGISGTSGTKSSGANERVDRSRRTSIDPGEYIDLTLEKNNARSVKREDFASFSYGKFNHSGGNSYISIERDGSIVMTSDDALHDGKRGNQFYAKFEYTVGAASVDCLYLRPANKENAIMLVNGLSYKGHEVPDLKICLPLYGYGRNRIEISPVMKDFIAMPFGTYWKEKK
ncbi:MAG: hypothetical protein LBI06_06005 [Treponema sp.]|jgi:hypothetical protein|nr:hypothetical protein [Treponema sp.]